MSQVQQLLSTNLDLSDGIYDKGKLVVVHQKGGIAADFLLHFLISDFIRRFGKQCRVILILNHCNVNRWVSVSSKLGYNLQTLIDNGQIEILDLLRLFYQSIISRIDHEKGSSSCTDSSSATTSSKYIDIEELLLQIKEKVNNFVASSNTTINNGEGQVKRILILVEDLSDLYMLQKPPVNINNITNFSANHEENQKPLLEFIRQLKYMNQDGYEGAISLLTLVKSTSGDDVSKRFSSLVTQVLSSVVFEISPLTTGFSANISGFLTVKCLRNNQYVKSSTMERHWLKNHSFKLEDRSIKITPL